MIKSSEYHTDTYPLNIDHILATLRDRLPDTARDLVARSRDISDPREKAFMDNPDDTAEHTPRWHQHGILTHSEKFREIMETDIPALMKEWGLATRTETALSQKIDGTSKKDLLQIVSLLHDLGKFTSRTFEEKNGALTAQFNDHEVHSGTIIRSSFKETLQELGLSEAQIEYIATCVEYHFELGKIRRVAVESETSNGYTMAFAQSDSFKAAAQDIIDATPKLSLEIGLMFIADSLSKTEITATKDTDERIESQRTGLEQQISAKGLNPHLINQALQQPVNMEVARQYLQVWAAQQATS